MKTLLLTALAAVGIALGTAGTAEAGWQTRSAHRWDPHCGRYVAYPERYWVPDYRDYRHDHRRDYYSNYHRDRGHYPQRSSWQNFDFRWPFGR